MVWDDGLVGTARDIAATNDSPLRVMAGPGTGKSFALKRRVARLLQADIDPRRILAVTFTRNAANSLVDGLHALGVEDCENVRAGTLHAFCFSLLSQQAVFDFLGRVPRPIVTFSKSGVLQFEGKAMLDDLGIAGAFGAGRECTRRIRAFEAAWARLQSEEPGWPDNAIDRQFQAALVNWLRFHRAILIGELVPEALRYLRNNPNCEARTAYDHVLVDEYQDLNRAEQELVELLAENGSLAIVGDVDQSIYRFRHANPEGIANYNASHPGTHDETLDECRRCPSSVVAIADQVIRNNHPAAAAARLRPMPGNAEGEIHIIQWNSIDEEASGLAGFIRALIEDREILPEEILVLTPRRLLGYKIRDRLRELGVAVHSFYHEEALEGASAQRAFALLSLLVDVEDRVALRWWLGEGSPSNRKNAYQRLRTYCEQQGISPNAALGAVVEGAVRLENVGDLVRKYRELRDILAELEGRTIAELIDRLMPPGDEECAAIRETALIALPELESVDDLLGCIRTHVTQPEMPEEGNFVRVMSLHKAKGLTARVAIVAGCTQGLVPYEDTKLPPAEQAAVLSEQRRLFYVAMTRCTEVLALSSFSRIDRSLAWKIGARVIGGRSAVATTVASQFMGELGPAAPAARRGLQWAEAGYQP